MHKNTETQRNNQQTVAAVEARRTKCVDQHVRHMLRQVDLTGRRVRSTHRCVVLRTKRDGQCWEAREAQ
jgi:stress response protein SCP2